MSVEYVRCPFCAFSKVLHSEKYEGGEFKWGELTTPPSEFTLLEVREALPGPGRGHKIKGFGGLQIVEELNMLQMLDDPQYANIAEQILYRLRIIFKDYIETGIFDISEFT